MTLDEALSSREVIKTRLRDMVADDMSGWGVTLKTVEIQDIQPSESMQGAMEQQAAAERDRKAMVTRSEGAKQSAILEAEGRLESAKRDAEAEVTLADASKKAILLVRETTSDPALPLQLSARPALHRSPAHDGELGKRQVCRPAGRFARSDSRGFGGAQMSARAICYNRV